jgi:hypothetical protein
MTTTFLNRELALVKGGRYEAAARHAARRAGVDPSLADGFCEVAANRLSYTLHHPAYVRETIETAAEDFDTEAARWWYVGEVFDFAHIYLFERQPTPVLAVLPDGSSIEYSSDEPHADWRHWLFRNAPDEDEVAVVKVAGDPATFQWLTETLTDAGWAVEVEVRG